MGNLAVRVISVALMDAGVLKWRRHRSERIQEAAVRWLYSGDRWVGRWFRLAGVEPGAALRAIYSRLPSHLKITADSEMKRAEIRRIVHCWLDAMNDGLPIAE